MLWSAIFGIIRIKSGALLAARPELRRVVFVTVHCMAVLLTSQSSYTVHPNKLNLLQSNVYVNNNSSADEIANVNFLRRQRTRRGQRLRPLNRLRNLYVQVPASSCEPEAGCRTSLQLIIYAPMHIKPSYHSLFCRNNR